MEDTANVFITNRDLLLFKYLFECKFLSREHIRKYIYEDLSPGHVTNRLHKLVKYGYLRKVPIATRETIILPTEKSLYALDVFRDRVMKLTRKNGFSLKYFPITAYEWYLKTSIYDKEAPINFKEFAHDNMVNEIRFYLEDKGAQLWIPNSVMRDRPLSSNVPDGIFGVKGLATFRIYNKNEIPNDALNISGPLIDENGSVYFKFDHFKTFTVALEYERSLKKRSRYVGGKNEEGILRRYARDKSINFVIYVTGDNYVYNSLAKILQPTVLKIADIPHALEKFYLIHERDLLNGDFRKMVNPFNNKVCPIAEFLNGGDER